MTFWTGKNTGTIIQKTFCHFFRKIQTNISLVLEHETQATFIQLRTNVWKSLNDVGYSLKWSSQAKKPSQKTSQAEDQAKNQSKQKTKSSNLWLGLDQANPHLPRSGLRLILFRVLVVNIFINHQAEITQSKAATNIWRWCP
jgi:hypothetical protein